MSRLLTTESVDASQRFAYWADLICDAFVQLECDGPATQAFHGSIRAHSLAGIELSVVQASAQRVIRSPRQIARSSEDFFLVSLQTRGVGTVRQDGREARLAPGDFALYDSTRPYELVFDDAFEQLVLMLPGERLRAAVRGTEQLTASAVSGRRGAGHLLIGMVRSLRRDIDSMEPDAAAAVADGLTSVLAAGLRTLPAAHCPPPGRLAAYHLQRVKAHVQARLADPTLSVATLAAELGLSPGHLHRLFGSEPLSLAEHIWAQRLQACRDDLADARMDRRSIADIAFGWGFNDAAHFSRAFRKRYGMSARDWRSAASAARSARTNAAALPATCAASSPGR